MNNLISKYRIRIIFFFLLVFQFKNIYASEVHNRCFPTTADKHAPHEYHSASTKTGSIIVSWGFSISKHEYMNSYNIIAAPLFIEVAAIGLSKTDNVRIQLANIESSVNSKHSKTKTYDLELTPVSDDGSVTFFHGCLVMRDLDSPNGVNTSIPIGILQPPHQTTTLWTSFSQTIKVIVNERIWLESPSNDQKEFAFKMWH